MQTKFDVNQVVCVRCDDEIYVTCPKCNGRGAFLEDGLPTRCSCNNGQVSKRAIRRQIREIKIEKILMYEDKIYYFDDLLGDGTDEAYLENELFATIEEARASE